MIFCHLKNGRKNVRPILTYADEAHRSSNNIYTKVINYFNPKLFLGMTATPDKRDDNQEGKNIYEIFHYQIAHEIRLQQAMEDNLLCPFHYFGISEVVSLDDKTFQATKLTEEELNQLTSDERVRHIIEQSEYYGYSGERVKGLIFCSRIKECEELSRKFNELGYRTVALSGADNEDKRQEAFERLAMDEAEATENMQPLDYIFFRDILNEGVDIVEVNQVIIMLRPTQSPIVFIQQLGRGLRKASGKEYVVILDFIGNYNNNFMIPVALSGERSYNADVSLLMNCGKDLSSIRYGMKRIKDEVFIFITYHKEESQDEKNYVDGKPDYADAFEDNLIFKWDSQIGKGLDSSYMQDVLGAARKHLLVKKSDAETNFYYMGQFDIVEAKK